MADMKKYGWILTLIVVLTGVFYLVAPPALLAKAPDTYIFGSYVSSVCSQRTLGVILLIAAAVMHAKTTTFKLPLGGGSKKQAFTYYDFDRVWPASF